MGSGQRRPVGSYLSFLYSWPSTRFVILTVLALSILQFLVLPLYESANEPRPSLPSPRTFVAVSYDGYVSPGTTWVQLKVQPPTSSLDSELVLLLPEGDKASQHTTYSVFLQPPLSTAIAGCDTGQVSPSGQNFDSFSDNVKQLVYNLVRLTLPSPAAGGNATDADISAAMLNIKFRKLTVQVDGTDNTSNSPSYDQVTCKMDTKSLWERTTSSALRDIAMPAVGLVFPVSAGQNSSNPDLSQYLEVNRGDRLSYSEGFPAPSQVDSGKDSFQQSSNSWSGSTGYQTTVLQPMIERYSDAVVESQHATLTFFSGVMAALAASLFGAGVLGLIDARPRRNTDRTL